jgi:hypothetical protein
VTAAPAVAAAPAKAEEEPEEIPDHEQVVGGIGVSWFGMSNVPIATGSPAGTGEDPAVDAGDAAFVPAPCLGIRYWFSKVAGLDVGVGFSLSTGSMATTSAAADKQTVLAFMYHVGVPISVVHGQHLSLQITPEVTIGHAHSEVEPTAQLDPPPNASLSGFRMDVGARVGAELQFGFIGVPELALEGSLGLYGTYQATSISVGEARAAENDLVIATGEYQSPWDIFTQHVRARYYF